MGNRVTVQFRWKYVVSPVVYLHWSANEVEAWLQELKELMHDRFNDPTYACARFIGICHTKLVGNLSLGVYNEEEIDADIVVNCSDFSYERKN